MTTDQERRERLASSCKHLEREPWSKVVEPAHFKLLGSLDPDTHLRFYIDHVPAFAKGEEDDWDDSGRDLCHALVAVARRDPLIHERLEKRWHDLVMRAEYEVSSPDLIADLGDLGLLLLEIKRCPHDDDTSTRSRWSWRPKSRSTDAS